MTEKQDSQPPGAGGQRRRALRWSVAAITFVVGLIVGGVLVGIVAGRSTQVPEASGSGSASSSPATPSAPASSSAAASAQVEVNQACLRSINAAQDVYQQLDALAQAAQKFDARRLDEVIRNLQPLEQRLRDSVPACQVTTRLPDGSVISGAPGSGAPSSPATTSPGA